MCAMSESSADKGIPNRESDVLLYRYSLAQRAHFLIIALIAVSRSFQSDLEICWAYWREGKKNDFSALIFYQGVSAEWSRISAFSWNSFSWLWSLLIWNPIGLPWKETDSWFITGLRAYWLMKNVLQDRFLDLHQDGMRNFFGVFITKPRRVHWTVKISRAFWRSSGIGAMMRTSSASTKIVIPSSWWIAFIIRSKAKLNSISLKGSPWWTSHSMWTGPWDPAEVANVVVDCRIRLEIKFLNFVLAPDLAIAVTIEEWEMLPNALERLNRDGTQAMGRIFMGVLHFLTEDIIIFKCLVKRHETLLSGA